MPVGRNDLPALSGQFFLPAQARSLNVVRNEEAPVFRDKKPGPAITDSRVDIGRGAAGCPGKTAHAPQQESIEVLTLEQGLYPLLLFAEFRHERNSTGHASFCADEGYVVP